MSFSLSYEFLFVGRDEESFLENYAYDISEEEEGREGHLFVTLEVQNNPADAERLGDIIFDTVRSVYFDRSQQEDSYDRFEEALKEVNNELKKLKSEKVSAYIGNMNIVVAVVQNGILHLTQVGDAEAYLVRRRFVSPISEGLGDGGDEDDVFSNIASGTIEAQDVLVFSSTRLLRYMTKNDLARTASSSDPVALLSDIKDMISTEILGKVGLAAICFTKAGDISTEELPSFDDEPDHGERSTDDEPDSRDIVSKSSKKRFPVSFSFGEAKERVKSVVSDFKTGGMSKQNILVVLIAVIVVLTFGVMIAKNNGTHSEYLRGLDQTLVEAQEAIDDAKTQGQYDKEAAAVSLSNAEEKAREVLSSGDYRAKANEVLQTIQATRDILDNVNRIEAPKVFADLTTKREDVNALGLIVDKTGRFYVFGENILFELVLNEIQDPVTLDETEQVIAGTYFSDKESLLFITKSGNVLEYQEGNINFLDTQDGSFRKAVDVATWANRMYLLDPENNQLWRYSFSAARDQFSVGESYNVDGDLKNAKDVSIDGAIYALNGDGYITKLFGGNQVDLPIKKQPFSGPQGATRLWTDDETSRIYVLDSAASKLFVYLKDTRKDQLVYSHQYLIENTGELRDFYIDKEANRAYLIDSAKVYEVEL